MMKITAKPFTLELKNPFGISKNLRNSTDIVIVTIELDGFYGFGEASLPPYLIENQLSVLNFIKKVNPINITYPFDFAQIHQYLDNLDQGNYAAKASIDIALHDLQGKIEQKALFQILDSNPEKMPYSAFTIGIDTPEVVIAKTKQANAFRYLKVKLGGEYDEAMIKAIRTVSFKPLYIDVNEGWKEKRKALDSIFRLRDDGAKLIEQPMPVQDLAETSWLSENSPVPIIADEAFQTIDDLEKLQGVYKGVVVKLMKCGGIYPSKQIIEKGKKLDLKIMMGCMNESSCAIMAAAALAPFCNFADLDGPFLLTNNPYVDPKMANGKIVLSKNPGLGLSSNS